MGEMCDLKKKEGEGAPLYMVFYTTRTGITLYGL
jgi:hypothetical protein